jgi:hypothetical protein
MDVEHTWNCQISRSVPQLGRSGIMCATILYPASFDMWNDSETARTVCPRFVSLATSWLSAVPGRGDGSLPRKHSVHRSRASYIHIAAFGCISAWLRHASASLPEMWFQAVIGPRLNGNSHTSRLAQFRESIHQLGSQGQGAAYLTASSTSSLVWPLKAL